MINHIRNRHSIPSKIIVFVFSKGKNVNLMSTKDFYNSVTPGSSLTHGTGLISEADYTKVTDADIHSDALFLRCEVPVPNSVLNKVNCKAMLNVIHYSVPSYIMPQKESYSNFLKSNFRSKNKVY